MAFLLPACSSRVLPQNSALESESAAEKEILQQTLLANRESYGALLAGQGIALPVSRPSIYVDEAGYMAGREKEVIFVGGAHGDTFDVVRRRDNAVVYTGTIPAGTVDAQTGLTYSKADFATLEETGTYYIYTDYVGQSYSFMVAEDSYEKLFLNLLRNVSEVSLETTPKGVCDVSFGMDVLMHALHYNGALFEAAYGHLAEGEQDKQLVAQLLYMAKWLTTQQGDDGSLYGDYEATAAFCGIMAMSRENFGKYEAGVSMEYEQAAQKAWKWLNAQECDTYYRQNARFYAAAQLFRTNGAAECKKAAEEYINGENVDFHTGRFAFYGALAYIGSLKGADRDLCTKIVMDFAERSEEICSQAMADGLFGTGAAKAQDNLSNMLHLSVMNYMTPSKEYTQVVEQMFQYMGGLNEDGVCYMGADGLWRDVGGTQGRNLEWNGIMLLGLSDMLKNFANAEQ